MQGFSRQRRAWLDKKKRQSTGVSWRAKSTWRSLISFPIPPSVLSGRCALGRINHCACRTGARVLGRARGDMLKLRLIGIRDYSVLEDQQRICRIRL